MKKLEIVITKKMPIALMVYQEKMLQVSLTILNKLILIYIKKIQNLFQSMNLTAQLKDFIKEKETAMNSGNVLTIFHILKIVHSPLSSTVIQNYAFLRVKLASQNENKYLNRHSIRHYQKSPIRIVYFINLGYFYELM